MGAISFLSARKTFPMPTACRASRTPDLLTLRNLDFFAPRASKKSKAAKGPLLLSTSGIERIHPWSPQPDSQANRGKPMSTSSAAA